MSDTLLSPQSRPAAKTWYQARIASLTGRRGRKVQEALLAYLLLLPAFAVIGLFGLFPLVFALYQSTLRGLNRIVGTYDGLGNYIRAIDNLTYVLGFWIAIAFTFVALRSLAQVQRQAGRYNEQPWLLAVPAAVVGASIVLFFRFLFRFLPEALGIADKMRAALQAGATDRSALFRQFLGEALVVPPVSQAWWLFCGVLLLGLLLTYVTLHWLPHSRHSADYYSSFVQATVLSILAVALSRFIWLEIQAVYAQALANGQSLDIWSQVITISAGFLLLGLSWWVWRSASDRNSNTSTWLRLTAAILLMVGAWVLIGELPRAIAAGDRNWWHGLRNTVYYSFGSIPFQFVISLMLATFLFQNIKGKSFFRIIYFLPYITPTVGAAAIFRVIFSGRADAPINQLLTSLGMRPLAWLNEPAGIFQILTGSNLVLPDWAVGPSLSLVVVIIFGIWTFVGFNTVIFLAGLGSIPGELYEAASIDGAGRWAQFRHVTLPLLSPTIYFLMLYAVIGTFKAFNHVYVLRTPAALGTVDTASIVIFDAFMRDTRYGYAATLSVLLLVIVMLLTIANNRIASRRVFYG